MGDLGSLRENEAGEGIDGIDVLGKGSVGCGVRVAVVVGLIGSGDGRHQFFRVGFNARAQSLVVQHSFWDFLRVGPWSVMLLLRLWLSVSWWPAWCRQIYLCGCVHLL
ncbi:hypothetical protein L484_010774 [Morus notabilis]|uniref:Uncharacterized protein n=1 Tax=Morus notabilis TaxID=981085 RepID=W9SYU5_9ROSA|nr:hypothetical protein L484_010774 [Morus notabilis]